MAVRADRSWHGGSQRFCTDDRKDFVFSKWLRGSRLRRLMLAVDCLGNLRLLPRNAVGIRISFQCEMGERTGLYLETGIASRQDSIRHGELWSKRRLRWRLHGDGMSLGGDRRTRRRSIDHGNATG